MSKRRPFEACATDIPSVAAGEGASRSPLRRAHGQPPRCPVPGRCRWPFQPLVLPVCWAPAVPAFSIVCFFRLPFSLGCLLLRDRSARTPSALRALTLYLPSLPQFAVSCYLPSALRSSAPKLINPHPSSNCCVAGASRDPGNTSMNKTDHPHLLELTFNTQTISINSRIW